MIGVTGVIETRSHLSSSQWSQLFSLLSLDGVSELYPYIGFDLPSNANFLSNLRECIVAARGQLATSQAKTGAEEFILPCLRTKLGERVYSQFTHWAATIFLGTHADQPEYSAWDIAFSQMLNRKNWPSDIPESKMKELIDAFRLAGDEKQALFDNKVPEIKKRPLSEWDVEIYNRQGWNHFEEFKDPYLSISLMISIHNTQRVLKTAQSLLSSEEQDALRNSSQKLLDNLGVWMPEPLQSISSLASRL